MKEAIDRIVELLSPHLGEEAGRERANNIMQVMVLEPDADIGAVAREMLQQHAVPESTLQDIERLPTPKVV